MKTKQLSSLTFEEQERFTKTIAEGQVEYARGVKSISDTELEAYRAGITNGMREMVSLLVLHGKLQRSGTR